MNFYSITNSATFENFQKMFGLVPNICFLKVPLLVAIKVALIVPLLKVILNFSDLHGNEFWDHPNQTFFENFQKLHYESTTISDTVDVQGLS